MDDTQRGGTSVRKRMVKRLAAVGGLALALSGAAGAARAECPGGADVARTVQSIDVRRTARLAVFGEGFPEDLNVRAGDEPGTPAIRRDGDQVYGAIVIRQPVEIVWMAINDEAHHASFLPVRHSEVIRGTPRGRARLLFQYFKKWGVGRWWVSEVTMNEELFRSSGGRLWELSWEDRMKQVDASQPPIRDVADGVSPIRSSRGRWLLVALNEGCALVDYANWTEPGGVVGALQWLMATRPIRDILKGIDAMTADHMRTPHPGPPFVRPDGTAIAPPSSAPPG